MSTLTGTTGTTTRSTLTSTPSSTTPATTTLISGTTATTTETSAKWTSLTPTSTTTLAYAWAPEQLFGATITTTAAAAIADTGLSLPSISGAAFDPMKGGIGLACL